MHSVHFKQPNVLYFGMGFGGIPYFIKMDSLHVMQLMFHPLNWEWVLYNNSLKGCSYVIRGVRQRRWWSGMLSGMLKKWLGCGTDHPICIGQRTLVNPLFMMLDVAFP